jgi:hypothetical protein
LVNSSTEDSLIVDFGRQELEDMVLNKDEALTHLRFRSAPLQGDDCSHIQGEHVLCIHKSPFKSHFYDAKVEKVLICILIYIQLPWKVGIHIIINCTSSSSKLFFPLNGRLELPWVLVV